MRRFGDSHEGTGQFFKDCKDGKLPSVVYIDPSFGNNDDHPPVHPALAKLSHYRSGANNLREGGILGGYMIINAKGGSLTMSGRLCGAPLADLPDATFVLHDGAPWLVLGRELLAWTPAGYGARIPRPTRGQALVITPPSLVAVLRAGWEPLVPLLHPSANA